MYEGIHCSAITVFLKKNVKNDDVFCIFTNYSQLDKLIEGCRFEMRNSYEHKLLYLEKNGKNTNTEEKYKTYKNYFQFRLTLKGLWFLRMNESYFKYVY